MVTSSNNFISDAGEGAIKGALDWSYNKIIDMVKKFKEKKLAFIKDPKTIEVVREQYESGESKFYEKYVKDRELLFIIRMGLTLRKLENDTERRTNLRDKIFLKYKVQGLHVAEFVENGMLNRYVGLFLESIVSFADIENNIKEILNNIDKHAIFVEGETKKNKILERTKTIINAHSPQIFVIAGIKSAAKRISECFDPLKVILDGYESERVSTENKEILFFKKTLPK